MLEKLMDVMPEKKLVKFVNALSDDELKKLCQLKPASIRVLKVILDRLFASMPAKRRQRKEAPKDDKNNVPVKLTREYKRNRVTGTMEQKGTSTGTLKLREDTQS